jgi:hypothetical protein
MNHSEMKTFAKNLTSEIMEKLKQEHFEATYHEAFEEILNGQTIYFLDMKKSRAKQSINFDEFADDVSMETLRLFASGKHSEAKISLRDDITTTFEVLMQAKLDDGYYYISSDVILK